MAYLLGFIFADGAILDTRKSTRTCYLVITICDLELLKTLKSTLNSCHKITTVPSRLTVFANKYYFCKEIYQLRIGSKAIFQDLINLGVTPRKSLRAQLPRIPDKYFNYFHRGYFDGDGCLNFYFRKINLKPNISVIFTSGSSKLLKAISFKLNNILKLDNISDYWNTGAYRLKYTGSSSMKLLGFMYKNLNSAPYLERKHNKFIQAMSCR